MLDLSPEKLLLLGIIAFVVLGPQRLPQVARTAGRWLSDLRRMSSKVQVEMRDALAEPREALSGAVQEMGLGDVKLTDLRPGRVRRAIAGSVTGAFLAPDESAAGAAGAGVATGAAATGAAATGAAATAAAPTGRLGRDGVPMDPLELPEERVAPSLLPPGAGATAGVPSYIPPTSSIPDDPSLN
ncbi:MAG: twin-arginine translocase TatA/TatE family subunit [Acidimicrobiales bacterium]